jgi:hypothetical protein
MRFAHHWVRSVICSLARRVFGVVYIIVYIRQGVQVRLSEQPGQCMPTILASACVGQNTTRSWAGS